MELQEALRLDPSTADAGTLRAAKQALAEQQQQQACRLCDEQLPDTAGPAGRAEGEGPEATVAGDGVGDAPGSCGAGSAAGGGPQAGAARPLFSLEQLAAMLRREDELRLSPQSQAAYAAAELRQDTDWMEVTAELQRRVVREAGVAPHQEEAALRALRAAGHTHPELKPLAIYHRGLVPTFHSLASEFRGEADVFAVYITEAHAQDEWPISSARFTPDRRPVLLHQPRSTEERIAAAQRFIAAFEFQVPMLVDPIDNLFDALFAPWPLRFYILQQGVLRYKSQPRDCSYDVGQLGGRLLELLGWAE